MRRRQGRRCDDRAGHATGVNIVARSLALEPGDEVLTTDHEYGACVATWQRRCAEAGAMLRTVAVPLPFDPEGFARRMLEAITPRTRLVFASHITSTTALVFPLRDLCAGARARGVATLVDGAHAPGQIDLDLSEVGADFYTGNCHKWLCAPKGSAFLHVRPDRTAGPALLEAPVVSGGYVAEQADAVGAPETVEAMPGDLVAEALRRWLCEERRIEVPVTQHGNRVFVRVSVQAYNNCADLDRLRDTLAEIGA